MDQQNLFFGDGYCIDANCIIEMWRRNYSFDVHKGLKEQIELMIQCGQIVAPKEVILELTDKDDELALWVKRNGFEVPDDPDQIRIAQEIINKYPPSRKELGKKYWADPFLIGLAEAKKLTLITQEQLSAGRPKIPNICKDRGVRCINILDFIREQNWTFELKKN